MIKKPVCYVLLCILLLSSLFPLCAMAAPEEDALYADTAQRVFDEADMLTDEEEAGLFSEIQRIQKKNNGVDLVLMTVNGTGGKTPEAYADDFYDAHNFGTDEQYTGLMLLVDWENRKYHVSTSGQAITQFSDMDAIREEIVPPLSDNNVYGSMDAFVRYVDAQTQEVLPEERVPGLHTETTQRVFDEAQVLTKEEEEQLTEYMVHAQRENGLDAVSRTVRGADVQALDADAEAFYTEGQFGIGETYDGVLLLIDADTREYAVYAHGKPATAFSDLTGMHAAIRESLDTQDVYFAFSKFVDYIWAYDPASGTVDLTRAQSTPEQGESQPPALNGILYVITTSYPWILPVSLGGGVLIAALTVWLMIRKHSNIRPHTDGRGYFTPDSFRLQVREDIFEGSHVTKTAIPKNDNNGTHTGSSGRSHGGGGGSF